MTTTELDRAAERAIATAQLAGARDVEVSWAAEQTEFIRFASSRFTQVGRTETLTLRIRVIAGDRMGTTLCASPRSDEIERAARAAVAVASSAPPLDVPLSFAGDDAGSQRGAAEPPPVPAGLTANAAPARLRDAFERAPDLRCAGALKVYRRSLGVATSAGASRRGGTTRADLSVIAQGEDASGWAGDLVYARPGQADDLDIAGTVDRAVDTARRGKSPTAVEPGAYDVVLAPAAFAELIEWMALASFGAAAVLDGTSLLCGRRGERICDPAIDVRDEPHPAEPTFDAEGMPRRVVAFIADGVAGEPATDRLTAARLGAGTTSTGSAPAVDGDFSSAIPARVRLRPGTSAESDLVRQIDRGLYVTRLHYVNGLLDTRRATMTGMTRDGTFLIERGEVTRGVKNMRFTETLLDALTSRLGGIADRPEELATWWSSAGTISTPAVFLRQFRFTGQSR